MIGEGAAGASVWRVQRATAVCIGLMLVLSPILSISTVIGSRNLAAPWWTVVSVVLQVATGGFIVTADERWRRWMPAAMILVCVAQVGILALWFPARTGLLSEPNALDTVWATGMSSAVGIGVVALFGYWRALVYTCFLLTWVAFVYSYAHYGHYAIGASYRAALSGSLLGVFLAVMRAGMGMARRLDEDRERVLSTTAQVAGNAARDRERARMDAVVRDEVIAVLRTARAGAPARVQRDQAVRALEALHGIQRTRRAATVDARAAYLRLRESVVGYGDHIAVVLEGDETAADYPVEAVDMMVDVVGEAIGNSLAHAGPNASQAVVGRLTDDGIRIRVLDDGIGFDPRTIPMDRMGIATGIRARASAVPGGAATVESAPGEGAMVSLEWRRP